MTSMVNDTYTFRHSVTSNLKTELVEAVVDEKAAAVQETVIKSLRLECGEDEARVGMSLGTTLQALTVDDH